MKNKQFFNTKLKHKQFFYFIFLGNCYAINIENKASRLNSFFSGYYVVSYGPNLEDFSLIPILGVIFGQNLGI